MHNRIKEVHLYLILPLNVLGVSAGAVSGAQQNRGDFRHCSEQNPEFNFNLSEEQPPGGDSYRSTGLDPPQVRLLLLQLIQV